MTRTAFLPLVTVVTMLCLLGADASTGPQMTAMILSIGMAGALVAGLAFLGTTRAEPEPIRVRARTGRRHIP